MGRLRYWEEVADRTVPTTTVLATIFEADVRGRGRMSIKVKAITEAFVNVNLDVKVADSDDDWITLLDSASDFNSTGNTVLNTSGADWNILSAGATAWIHLDTVGWARVRLQVDAADAGTITYSYGADSPSA